MINRHFKINTLITYGANSVVMDTCGTIVVSRDTAGTSDIIDGDEYEFGDKVVELLENENRLNDMSIYAKNMIVDKFDKDNMFDDIINSVQKISTFR